MLAVIAEVETHAWCHVTGGGLPGNLPRVLPTGMGAQVDTGVVGATAGVLLARRPGADRGVRAVADVQLRGGDGGGVLPDAVDAALAVLGARDVDAWVLGTVHRRRACGWTV